MSDACNAHGVSALNALVDVMRFFAGELPKALNSALVGGIIFLTMLPCAGLAVWHDVLPEHTHIFLNPAQGAPFDSRLLYDPDACMPHPESQACSSILHIPAFSGLLVALAIVVIPSFLSELLPDFSTRVIFPHISFHSPELPLPDPPPKSI